MPRRPEKGHDHYHAHVYFDDATFDQAEMLCLEAWRACHIGVGRMHRKPVGPHPRWSCQLTFDAAEFDRLIPWLDVHRNGLDILVHPLTGDELMDHSVLASWLGNDVPLRLEVFES